MSNLTPSTYEQALAYLTINSSFTGDLGLFHGRMGIILFFAHYAHATKSKHYEDFAGCLLDELYEEIHEDLPINLENGLCGIGWGIEYLVQHGFMEGDTDEILADIDRKVMELDPLRMTNLSFRRGLAGVVFYVITRLNAHRATSALPFDAAYLTSLQQALERAKFTEAAEIPADLPGVFNRVLEGEKLKLSLPDCLTHSELSLDKPFDEILLGLEEGLAGWLWGNLDPAAVRTDWLPKADKCIFLFDEESRSTKYGIGTYVNQLTDALQDTEWQVVRVRTFSCINQAFMIYEDKAAIFIDIVRFKNRNYEGYDIEKRYYRNLFFCIYTYLDEIKRSVFHLNMMQCDELAILLKKYFPQNPLVLTVHYLNWGIELLGDKQKLMDVLKNAQDRDWIICKSFEMEKRLMALCDKIIVMTLHTRENLIVLYQVPQKKIIIVPHGIKDSYLQLSKRERIKIREKYDFSKDDQILIFAGRIDYAKGIEYLVKAFILLVSLYPKLRLIIVGEGNFRSLFSQLNIVWSKVTCTGFVDKQTLYELFSISDVGVLPSLYEEFGLVALEMMMMKLPIIAGKTTGFSELIIDGQSGRLVALNNNEYTKSTLILKKYIKELIEDDFRRVEFVNTGRALFLKKYSLEVFKNHMRCFYTDCFYTKS